MFGGGGIVFTEHEERYATLKDYVFKTRKPITKSKLVSKFLFVLSLFFTFKPIIYSFVLFVRKNTSLLEKNFNEKYDDIFKDCPDYFEDMCEFQKGVGLGQLNKIQGLLHKRRKIGNIYYKLLSSSVYKDVLKLWKIDVFYSHIPFLHPKRDELKEYLNINRIDTEKYFDYIIPELHQYQEKGKFPNAKYLSENIINLPINIGLREKDILMIVNKIKQFDTIT